jgi:diaminopimelate epimerase
MNYYKYDASGNDFVIFYTTEKKDYSKLAIELCAKDNFDTDGLVALLPHETLDFQWQFYNNDGSEASMCGNATRAVALFASTHGYAKESMSFLTGAGVISCRVDGDLVETQMTKPIIVKEPFTQDGYDCWIVDTGVPHVVIMTENIDSFDEEVCARFRHQYNANVNFASVVDGKLLVRTFERGVEGETLACGTGMVASFLRANNLGLIGNEAKVYPTSKEELTIKLQDGVLYFSGRVKFIQSREMK